MCSAQRGRTFDPKRAENLLASSYGDVAELPGSLSDRKVLARRCIRRDPPSFHSDARSTIRPGRRFPAIRTDGLTKRYGAAVILFRTRPDEARGRSARAVAMVTAGRRGFAPAPQSLDQPSPVGSSLEARERSGTIFAAGQIPVDRACQRLNSGSRQSSGETRFRR